MVLGYIKKVAIDIDGAVITLETQDVDSAIRELLPHRREQVEISITGAQAELPLMPQTTVVRHTTPLSASARVKGDFER